MNSAPDWQHRAFDDTVSLASTHGMPLKSGDPLGLAHLMGMRSRAQAYSGAKLGRWLGWAQCAVVAADIGLTLEDMEAINTRAAEEFAASDKVNACSAAEPPPRGAPAPDPRLSCGSMSPVMSMIPGMGMAPRSTNPEVGR